MREQIYNTIINRVEKLKAYMVKENLDGVIISSPENVFYFSHFNPIIVSRKSLIYIEWDKEPVLITHALRGEHASRDSVLRNISLYGNWGSRISCGDDEFSALAEYLSRRAMCIGLEEDYISYSFMKQLRYYFKNCKFFDVTNQLHKMRGIKDYLEISRIRDASYLVSLGMKQVIEALQSGASEIEACTTGQYAMREEWGKRYHKYEISGFGSAGSALFDGLNMWCLTNERITHGCDCSTAYIPNKGDIVLPMGWARLDGYVAEIERCILVEPVSQDKQDVFNAALWAREGIYKILQPGITLGELYDMAAKIFSKKGFNNFLPGRCGHGIGLAAHEFPSISKNNRTVVQPGMVFTVEPGLMVPGLGGARLSDTVLITKNGYEILTTSD